MSDREKAIEVLETMPADVSLKDILEALNLMFEINNRVDDLDINECISTDELIEEMKEWEQFGLKGKIRFEKLRTKFKDVC